MSDTKDERIAELEAELRKRDGQDELWRVIRVWRTRADEEFEHAQNAEHRAEVMERALRQAKARLERGWDDAAMRELEAALAQPKRDQAFASYESADLRHNAACVSQDAGDQPAQDGEQTSKLEPHQRWAYAQGWNDAMRKAAFMAQDHANCTRPLSDSHKTVHALETQAQYCRQSIRSVHPNRPADAGEPDKGRSIRQQISEAQEKVAAWPEWMTKSAKVHEPSCCARTREECANVARKVGAVGACPYDEYERGWHDCAQAIARDLGKRAAIRRTGDTP
jgi:hypothetical protein